MARAVGALARPWLAIGADGIALRGPSGKTRRFGTRKAAEKAARECFRVHEPELPCPDTSLDALPGELKPPGSSTDARARGESWAGGVGLRLCNVVSCAASIPDASPSGLCDECRLEPAS